MLSLWNGAQLSGPSVLSQVKLYGTGLGPELWEHKDFFYIFFMMHFKKKKKAEMLRIVLKYNVVNKVRNVEDLKSTFKHK